MEQKETGFATGQILASVLASSIAYVLYTVIYNVYFHPLAKFPGPYIAGATIYWKAYVECISQRSFCHYLIELHAQHGKAI